MLEHNSGDRARLKAPVNDLERLERGTLPNLTPKATVSALRTLDEWHHG